VMEEDSAPEVCHFIKSLWVFLQKMELIWSNSFLHHALGALLWLLELASSFFVFMFTHNLSKSKTQKNDSLENRWMQPSAVAIDEKKMYISGLILLSDNQVFFPDQNKTWKPKLKPNVNLKTLNSKNLTTGGCCFDPRKSFKNVVLSNALQK
jgi:hypothetical protein